MNRILAGAFALVALALASCTTPTIDSVLQGSNPAAPVAASTAIDERVLAGVYSTAGAAERAYAVAYDAGVLQRGQPNTVAARLILDTRVGVAVHLAQSAYDAGNAATLNVAIRQLIDAAGEVGRLTGRTVEIAPALRR